MCSAFRNEGAGVASELISHAIALTRAFYGEPPLQGMVTFIDTKKVHPTMTRGVKTWGRTWKLAGFREVGFTEGGLLALGIYGKNMPAAEVLPIEQKVHADFRSVQDLHVDIANFWMAAP